MRFMWTINFPTEAANAAAKAGKLGQIIRELVEEQKPEAAYFVDNKGMRTAVLILDMQDASQIAEIAEPWMLALNARVEVHPVMVLDDLAKAMPAMEAAAKRLG